MTKDSPDQMLSQLLEIEDSEASGLITHRLLKALFMGYPVENLRRLLQSPHSPAARAGAYLLSEVGPQARVLLPELLEALDHPDAYVRFHALDSILVAATTADGAVIARAVEVAVSDQDDAVRWNGLRFLAHATDAQLTSAASSCTETRIGHLTEWLTSIGMKGDGSAVAQMLDSPDKVERLFAAAAAARQISMNRDLLSLAMGASDPDVRSFAESELRLRRPPRR